MDWGNPYRWVAAHLRRRGRPAEAGDADPNTGAAVAEEGWVGEALRWVEAGRSVVVVAPTGAGKTNVGIGALKLRGGGWYLAPTRALCHEKAREIAAQTPLGWEAVAVANRDTPSSVGALLRAKYRVATPHKLSQLLPDIPPSHWEHTVVVVDEAHNLEPTAETLITYLATHGAQIVALTATLREEDEQAYTRFIGGGGDTERQAKAVRYRGPRRVPIEYRFVRITRVPGGSGWYTPYGYRGSVEEFAASYAYRLHAEEPDASIIVWAPRRRTCNTLAEIIARTQPIITAAEGCWCTLRGDGDGGRGRDRGGGGSRGTQPTATNTTTAAATATVVVTPAAPSTPNDNTLIHTLPHGVGVHHGGLTPTDRELVHRLYKTRAIHTLCTAYTLAQGVNLPARHLILTGLRDPRGQPLDPTTFHQLAGRAGRPGLDSRGTVHIILTSDEDEKLAAQLTATPAAPLASKLAEQSPRFYERLAARLIAGGNNTPRKIAGALRHTYYSEAGGPHEWAKLARHMRRAVDTLIEKGAIRVRSGAGGRGGGGGKGGGTGAPKRSFDEEYEFSSKWWWEAARRGLSTQEAQLAECIPTLEYGEAVTRTLTAYTEAKAEVDVGVGEPLSVGERQLIVSLGLLAQYHPQATPKVAEAAEAVQSFLDTATLIHAHTKGWSHPDTQKAKHTAQRFAAGGGRLEEIVRIIGDNPHTHARLKQLVRTYGQHLTTGRGTRTPLTPAQAEHTLTILLGHPKTWGPEELEKADRLRSIILGEPGGGGRGAVSEEASKEVSERASGPERMRTQPNPTHSRPDHQSTYTIQPTTSQPPPPRLSTTVTGWLRCKRKWLE